MTNTRRKIVPVEATEEMLCDGWYHATRNGNTERVNSDDFIPAYKAMITAAPDASQDDEFVRALESAAYKAIMECNAFDPQSQSKAATSAILKTIEGGK